jgi:hypothetical protein
MTTPVEGKGTAAADEHWVRTLYERYVQLYGDPIEQPITTESRPAEGHDQHPG